MDKHSASPITTDSNKFPLFSQSGTAAAELWLTAASMSLAAFRESRFKSLVVGLGQFDDLAARRQAFDDAFAARIATEIAGGNCHA